MRGSLCSPSVNSGRCSCVCITSRPSWGKRPILADHTRPLPENIGVDALLLPSGRSCSASNPRALHTTNQPLQVLGHSVKRQHLQLQTRKLKLSQILRRISGAALLHHCQLLYSKGLVDGIGRAAAASDGGTRGSRSSVIDWDTLSLPTGYTSLIRVSLEALTPFLLTSREENVPQKGWAPPGPPRPWSLSPHLEPSSDDLRPLPPRPASWSYRAAC